MAINTTQSISRSNGGDNSRTTYAGSMVMAAQFYIADASVATPANILNQANGQAVILPKGAVVLSVAINDAGEGTVDIGTRDVSDGTLTNAAIANGLDVSALGAVTAGLTNTPIAEMAYATVTIDTAGAGTVAGYLTYFVVDPLAGQQAV